MAKKRVLVTGSAGFIFSNFIRWALRYHKSDFDFVSVDKIAISEGLHNIYANKGHKFYIGDICDRHFMDIVFQIEKPDFVINGAAFSHVDDSIKNANDFILSNILGTQVIIDKCVEYDVKRFVQCSCYDSNTRAVTRNGLKHWYELNDGDLVLSINPDTGAVEEKKIKKIIIQDYNGKMMLFEDVDYDFCVTPNHRCLYTDHPTKNNSKIYWSSAEDIFDYNNKYLPIGVLSDKKRRVKDIINIKKIGEVDSLAFFYVCGFFIEGLNICKEKKIATKEAPKNNEIRKKLEKSLAQLGIEYYFETKNFTEFVCISSKKWVKFFKQLVCIPEWFFNHNSKLLFSLWLGIHDGSDQRYDVDGKTAKINTKSAKLTGQLCYLGSCVGFFTQICKKHSTFFIDNKVVKSNSNDVYFSPKTHPKPKINKPQKIDYNGKIWCLSVEDNKNFLVERNGCITYSGNTDEVYGQLKDGDQPWTENSPLLPRNPYSASKGSADLLVNAANETHGLQFNITRSCNNFGPRQSASKFIPKIIKCIIEEKPIPVYGQGAQIREWIYVADNCSAIMEILNGPPNETYNISSGYEISNIELVNIICNIMGKGHSLITFVDDRAGHDFRYSLDSSKLKELGWKPNFKFKEALSFCVKWYLNNKWFLK